MSSHGFRSGFIAIIGRPNVGKSTLLNHLIGQKISITSRKAQTTRHRISGILTEELAQFVFVDTPGFQTTHLNGLNRGLNRVVTSSLRDVSVVLFVIEALNFDERDSQVLKLLPQEIPVLLVINKIDNLESKLELLPFMQLMAKQRDFSAIVPVSAKRDTQLDTLLDAIRPYLPEGDKIYHEDEVTDRNERFIAGELIREQIFRLTGDELPYSVSVVIEQFKVEGKLRRIHSAILVDKDSHKAMLIGKNGEKLKEIATQARLAMERLFDGKVHLEVWIKVRSGWADNAYVLKSLGYD
ncbi:MAG: GTPase Era [Candidatus Nitrotoga sp.]|jgi:GTP-binding protein Era|nr:GTPase Era [Candidatus Nitrotoga sp.]MCX7187968.1 GTPase Era [Pseudomonadota bacterium]MBA0902365.1 GTPase Era [Candidatus Nitrotoga sp.]MBP0117768.1 GTPase Era [Candidatus Nitrotoga sp.]MBP0118809.1 GTPase Era [Candidatus Nitrotoga sp.]